LVTSPAEDGADEIAHSKLVIDDEDDGVTLSGFQLLECEASPFSGRKKYPERAPLCRCALYDDATRLGSQNSGDSRKPESSADKLRREERIENLRLLLQVDATAGIAHFDAYIATGRYLLAEFVGKWRLDIGRRGRYGDSARIAVPNRLARVDDEIHQNLLKLAGVHRHPRQASVQIQGQAGALGDRELD